MGNYSWIFYYTNHVTSHTQTALSRLNIKSNIAKFMFLLYTFLSLIINHSVLSVRPCRTLISLVDFFGNWTSACVIVVCRIEGAAWQFRTATIVLAVFCGLLLILSLCLCCCWPWTKKPVAVSEKPLQGKEKVVYYEVPGDDFLTYLFQYSWLLDLSDNWFFILDLSN
jgi:magnesium-transporting ATPase (P-type)